MPRRREEERIQNEINELKQQQALADEKLRAATLQDPLVAKAAAEKREVEMKMAARMEVLKKKKQAEIDKREAEEREKTIAEAVFLQGRKKSKTRGKRKRLKRRLKRLKRRKQTPRRNARNAR